MTDEHHRPSSPQFFNQEMAESYDEKNSKLTPISDNMHFLVRLVLADLPPQARILCVGVGTGAEIVSLAHAQTGWSFVGVDPSAEMLEVCRRRLKQANVLDRCELAHGYIDQAPQGEDFDAVLSMLVAHFIARSDRSGFYREIRDRLKPGGYFISTEICVDLDSAEFPAMLKNWERVQTLMGATPDSLQKLPEMLRDTLSVLSPSETRTLLKTAGFDLPVPFFQAFLVRGFFAKK
ncbi:tRNA (cmo5U34)-methyltransferase [Breoghania corrubedonensis]|uniref:tRNA (Cmo5U34)-methyltransferase n=1 Tax=Breoghania corrubedonensis TaxID=665038 RepID=A0A2T5VHE1_9HYPH|nr:class I SAM-dependent methyltransferase [Breoghania corrubedonensis]PTW63163.1 tRNA (cmo5U34)-methyltransferase [Breoghania corrubedonensis]